MNKIIIALITLALVATPALASMPTGTSSEVQTELYGNGQTWFSGLATVSGKDWSESGTLQVTGMIGEYLHNVGSVHLVSEVEGTGQWNLQEEKNIWGSGTTEIDKAVEWWTEDSTKVDGYMKWPTEAHIYTGFFTPTKTVETQVDNIADKTNEGPTGEFSYSSFLQNIETNEGFTYIEGVGINMPTECTPEHPHLFPLPICDGCV
jgi:hypothetical protein